MSNPNYDATTEQGTENIWEDPNNPNPPKNRFGSHREAEQHYYSCQLNNYQVNLLLGRYVATYGHFPDTAPPDPTPPSPNLGTEQHFGGANGHVWKPVSDSKKKPVFVMDKKYTQGQKDGGANLAGTVTVYSQANPGEEVDKLHWRNSGNGGRGNHDASKTAEQLSPYAPLVLKWAFNGQPEYIVVVNPKTRYE